MRHRVAERLHLLVNGGELRSSFPDLRLDFRINRQQFDLTLGNEDHFTEALTDGYDKEDNFKSDPPGMYHGPPETGIKNAIYRLRPIVAADYMIDVNDHGTGNQNPPIAIKRQDGQ